MIYSLFQSDGGSHVLFLNSQVDGMVHCKQSKNDNKEPSAWALAKYVWNRLKKVWSM